MTSVEVKLNLSEFLATHTGLQVNVTLDRLGTELSPRVDGLTVGITTSDPRGIVEVPQRDPELPPVEIPPSGGTQGLRTAAWSGKQAGSGPQPSSEQAAPKPESSGEQDGPKPKSDKDASDDSDVDGAAEQNKEFIAKFSESSDDGTDRKETPPGGPAEKPAETKGTDTRTDETQPNTTEEHRMRKLPIRKLAVRQIPTQPGGSMRTPTGESAGAGTPQVDDEELKRYIMSNEETGEGEEAEMTELESRIEPDVGLPSSTMGVRKILKRTNQQQEGVYTGFMGPKLEIEAHSSPPAAPPSNPPEKPGTTTGKPQSPAGPSSTLGAEGAASQRSASGENRGEQPAHPPAAPPSNPSEKPETTTEKPRSPAELLSVLKASRKPKGGGNDRELLARASRGRDNVKRLLGETGERGNSSFTMSTKPGGKNPSMGTNPLRRSRLTATAKIIPSKEDEDDERPPLLPE